MTGRKVTLCPTCVMDGGWHYPDDGEPFRPHHGEVTGARLEDEALAATVAANESAYRSAKQIIADAAREQWHVDGNTVRERLKHAGISREDGNSGVIGLAFRHLYEAGTLEPDGMVKSTDPGTHGHRITRWRSRVYAPQQLGVGS